MNIGEIFISKDGRMIIVRVEGGISGFSNVSEVLAVIGKSLTKAPLRAKSFLGVDVVEAVRELKKAMKENDVKEHETSIKNKNQRLTRRN